MTLLAMHIMPNKRNTVSMLSVVNLSNGQSYPQPFKEFSPTVELTRTLRVCTSGRNEALHCRVLAIAIRYHTGH